MIDEGENSEVEKDLVKVTFDPFKEQTLTSSYECIHIQDKIPGSHIYINFSHIKNPKLNLFYITFETLGFFKKGEAEFENFIITADQEVIDPEESPYSEEPTEEKWPGEIVDGHYEEEFSEYKSYGNIIFSPEAIKKIVSASNIECRYYDGASNYYNLESDDEETLKIELGILYNETIDSNTFSNITKEKEDKNKKTLEKIEKELNENKKKQLNKKIKIIKWCLIVMFVYFLLYFFVNYVI